MRRIFRYLQGILSYGFWYSRRGDSTLQVYTNVNWVGCIDDMKSTSGGTFFLGDRLVSWHNKKKDTISLSNNEAKYIAIATCCSQVLLMK